MSSRVWPSTGAGAVPGSIDGDRAGEVDLRCAGRHRDRAQPYPSGAGSRTSAVPAPSASTASAPAGQPPSTTTADPDRSAASATVSSVGGQRGAGQAAQLGGERRAEERGVGEPAAELLGDDRRLDARTPTARTPPSAVRSSRQPEAATAASSFVGPLAIVELADGARAEAVDDLGDRVAQRLLLGGEADVHQLRLPRRGAAASSSSRSVRRSTLPDGSRGIASTTTTWRRCL